MTKTLSLNTMIRNPLLLAVVATFSVAACSTQHGDRRSGG